MLTSKLTGSKADKETIRSRLRDMAATGHRKVMVIIQADLKVDIHKGNSHRADLKVNIRKDHREITHNHNIRNSLINHSNHTNRQQQHINSLQQPLHLRQPQQLQTRQQQLLLQQPQFSKQLQQL